MKRKRAPRAADFVYKLGELYDPCAFEDPRPLEVGQFCKDDMVRRALSLVNESVGTAFQTISVGLRRWCIPLQEIKIVDGCKAVAPTRTRDASNAQARSHVRGNFKLAHDCDRLVASTTDSECFSCRMLPLAVYLKRYGALSWLIHHAFAGYEAGSCTAPVKDAILRLC